ncbi:MAG: hypothetical protein KAV00_05370 [Phycisphaerae bacterium]|nr:hypothetical protein [Phycisphaerae bacterium]
MIKTDHPERMRVEVEKSRRAYEIGQASGLFRVPRVLQFDETTGKATFERYHGIKPTSDIIAFSKDSKDLLVTLGKALATIHKELVLPDDMRIPLPPECSLPGETDVFFHGDFTCTNVCLKDCEEKLIILDWQMAPRYGGLATYGTRYFDLVWFVIQIFHRLLRRHVMSRPAGLSAELFLQSYFAHADGKWSVPELRAYMRCLLDREAAHYLRSLPWLTRWLLKPAYASLRAFVESFRIE